MSIVSTFTVTEGRILMPFAASRLRNGGPPEQYEESDKCTLRLNSHRLHTFAMTWIIDHSLLIMDNIAGASI